MNKQFKQLILKMAHLPHSDQQWVMSQLTPVQQEQFKQNNGDMLLAEAHRFRKMRCPEIPESTPPLQLPHLCKELQDYPSLFIAIILEQGGFAWELEFLTAHAMGHDINQLKNEVVSQLKSATKLLVFQHWQTQLSFQDQLEDVSG